LPLDEISWKSGVAVAAILPLTRALYSVPI